MVIDFYSMMDLHNAHISILLTTMQPVTFFGHPKKNNNSNNENKKLEMREAPLEIEWCSC